MDAIQYPKRLAPYRSIPHPPSPERDAVLAAEKIYNAPWHAMHEAKGEIRRIALLATGLPRLVLTASSKSRVGATRRAEATTAWRLETRKVFLAAYQAATAKRRLAEIQRQVAEIQGRQKPLLVEIRRRNSEYVAAHSQARAEQRQRNVEAMASGRFWEADRDAIKAHFHPPFGKNFLADVSKRWRAALFVECASESYPLHGDRWGHKLTGIGNGYLCGIDDNGDEWGHRVGGLCQGYDDFGSLRPEGTVEEAMSILFDVPMHALATCVRQGDLLFRPLAHLPEEVELDAEETWEPRPSHTITGHGLRHNGRFFDAPSGATITHTSHAAVALQVGAYCLHVFSADAD